MSHTHYADLYDLNMKASIARQLTNNSDIPAGDMNFGDSLFNPAEKQRWIEVVWVNFGKSVLSHSSFHVRCFGRPHEDRYGRELELLIGSVRNSLSVTGGVPLYDYVANPTTPQQITIGSDFVFMAVRYGDRSPTMDAANFGESTSPVKGVHVVVLSYDVYVPRAHEQW